MAGEKRTIGWCLNNWDSLPQSEREHIDRLLALKSMYQVECDESVPTVIHDHVAKRNSDLLSAGLFDNPPGFRKLMNAVLDLPKGN